MKTPMILTVLLWMLAATGVSAQGQFGRAVAAGPDGQVFVLKPTSGRGPAAVYVFGQSEPMGEWNLEQELHAPGGVETGHALGASLSTHAGALLVAGGDPGVGVGAHVFRQDGGGWLPDGQLAIRAVDASALASQALNLQGLMRIMRPARRTVSATGGIAVIGVVGGTSETNGVRVFRRDRETTRWLGPWPATDTSIVAEHLFGASVAVTGELVMVGAPRYGEGGAVFVMARAGEAWTTVAVLTGSGLAPSSGFGTALRFVNDVLVVSAPGGQEAPGTVLRFERRGDGWFETDRVIGHEAGPGAGFGAAFDVVGDDLWIGAPLADQRRGLVYHYTRRPGGWELAETLGSGLADERALFGTSVAASRDRVVAGAPAAAGGVGRAVVWVRTGDRWSDPSILSPGGSLEMMTGREVVCDAGQAAGYDCQNVDLLSFLPIDALGGQPGERVSDIWGWTDPVTGREFALVGRTGGAVFVDVTDPTSPIRIGELPANASGARDLKVYRNHLFFTGDGAGQHGLIVFDLTRLRDVTNPPAIFEADASYDGIASAHNLIIDGESGFAFPVGASGGGETCGGGLHMVDIRDPLRPTFAGCYTDTEGLIWSGRTHDGQCVAYRGPDENYRGRQLCFASNETALRIVDVTDKQNPVAISAAAYPGIAYAHQGWLTDDQRYFYLNDELDELVGNTTRTRTLVWDVAELDDPVMIGEFFGPNGSTDHNLYVRGNRMYQANYQAGLRVIDISDPEHPVEVGFFDTTPYEGDPPGFVGAWTAFPFFESGTVIVSSMNEGLFVLRPRPGALIP